MVQRVQVLNDGVSVQAWPEDAPESQPRKSWSSESRAPSEEAGHNKDPLHTEVQVRVPIPEYLLCNCCHADSLPAHYNAGS